MDRKQRDSNMELLRILAAFGVIVLHYNNASIGGAYGAVAATSPGAFVLYFLEALSLCAVDLFMMLTGYFQCKKRSVNLAKPLMLLLQVSIVRIVAYFVGGEMNLKGLLTAIAPSNHFIALYCTVYVLSPYLNLVLERLNQKNKKILAVILLLLFSVQPTVLNFLGSFGFELNGMSTVSNVGASNGYTLVNYILMYILGALCNDIRPGKKSILGFILCLLPLFFFEISRQVFGLRYWQRSYCNPLVIGCALFALLSFRELKLSSRRWINTLSGGALMVYLTHKHLFPLFRIPEAAAKGTASVLLNLLVTCVACYLAGWVLHTAYTFVTKPLAVYLTKKLERFSITTQ